MTAAAVTAVEDTEILYRRVPLGQGLYSVTQGGAIRISSQAFADRLFRPSVNRAMLCDFQPAATQARASDGVLSLVASDLRAIADVEQPAIPGPGQSHLRVDVEHVPLVENPAHAEIFTDPVCTKNAFRRLCERLARLAEARPWEITPQDIA